MCYTKLVLYKHVSNKSPGLGIRSLVFQVNHLFFWEQKSDGSERAMGAKERLEQIVHSRSIVVSDKSDSLTDAPF